MKRFIVGTDWWTDCDDVVAMRILARAVRSGQIEIACIGLNACMEYSAPSLEGFLLGEGVEDILIGIDREATDFGGRPPYQERLAGAAIRYRQNADAEDAVRLYRRMLAAAEEPLQIIEIGYPQVLSGVLQSGPDDLSEKSGLELVAEKAEKLWIMAGKWDEEIGRENNFARNLRSRRAGSALVERCPSPITFLGWETGADVITGKYLAEDDPLHLALIDHGSASGRSSWDPMLAVLALEGDEERAGYSVVRGRASVDGATGENRFERCADGMHCYVVRRNGPAYYEEIIERMIASEE